MLKWRVKPDKKTEVAAISAAVAKAVAPETNGKFRKRNIVNGRKQMGRLMEHAIFRSRKGSGGKRTLTGPGYLAAIKVHNLQKINVYIFLSIYCVYLSIFSRFFIF